MTVIEMQGKYGNIVWKEDGKDNYALYQALIAYMKLSVDITSGNPAPIDTMPERVIVNGEIVDEYTIKHCWQSIEASKAANFCTKSLKTETFDTK